jgi:hypothetical protein
VDRQPHRHPNITDANAINNQGSWTGDAGIPASSPTVTPDDATAAGFNNTAAGIVTNTGTIDVGTNGGTFPTPAR